MREVKRVTIKPVVKSRLRQIFPLFLVVDLYRRTKDSKKISQNSMGDIKFSDR